MDVAVEQSLPREPSPVHEIHGMVDTRSINAPELDQDTYAPQHYPLPEGLQLPLDTAPEILLDTDPPIPRPDNTNSKEVVKNKRGVTKSSRSKRVWIAVCALVLVLGVVIGVGVAFSPDRPSPSVTDPSPTSSNSATLVPTTSIGATPAPSQIPIHGVLNDTSLAAILESSGDKHVFFQDLNSSLRHTVYYGSLGEWSNAAEFIQPERQPRNHTPISVIESHLPIYVGPGGVFEVYYVDVNNTLASFQYVLNRGAVINSSSLNQSFSISTGARSLSAAHRPPGTLQNTSDEILLFYLSPSNDLNVLYSDALVSPFSGSFLKDWQNFSGLFSAFNIAGSGLSSPFSVYPDANTLTGLFFKPSSVDDIGKSEFLGFDINNATFLANTGSPLLNEWTRSSNHTPDSVLLALASGESDLLLADELYAVGDRTLNVDGSTAATGPFPFGRLTSIFLNNTLLVYHQFNDSFLLEAVRDRSSGVWGDTNFIAIPTG